MIADIRVGLVAYLAADTDIAASVEWAVARQNGGKRIFPVVLPQGVNKTSIVYSRISGLGDHHMEGASGLSRPRVQIDCWATDPDAADLLSRRVKQRIDGFRGSLLWGDNSPEEAIVVQGIFFESEREDYDGTAKLYRSSRDYFVWFEER